MTVNNDSFFREVNNFIEDNKILCVFTFGLAIVFYSVGNLAGRAVSWIIECCNGTTQKTQNVANEHFQKENLGTDQIKDNKKEKVSSTLPVQLVPTKFNNIEWTYQEVKYRQEVDEKGLFWDWWDENNKPFYGSQEVPSGPPGTQVKCYSPGTYYYVDKENNAYNMDGTPYYEYQVIPAGPPGTKGRWLYHGVYYYKDKKDNRFNYDGSPFVY